MNKTILIILVCLILVSFVLAVYDFNNNEIIKTKFNKAMGLPCTVKQLPNGWGRIENCAEYKYVGDK